MTAFSTFDGMFRALSYARPGDVVPVPGLSSFHLYHAQLAQAQYTNLGHLAYAQAQALPVQPTRYTCAYCEHTAERGHPCRNCGARERQTDRSRERVQEIIASQAAFNARAHQAARRRTTETD